MQWLRDFWCCGLTMLIPAGLFAYVIYCSVYEWLTDRGWLTQYDWRHAQIGTHNSHRILGTVTDRFDEDRWSQRLVSLWRHGSTMTFFLVTLDEMSGKKKIAFIESSRAVKLIYEYHSDPTAAVLDWVNCPHRGLSK